MECPVCNMILAESGYCTICGSSNTNFSKSELSEGSTSIELPFGIKQLESESSSEEVTAMDQNPSKEIQSSLIFGINHAPDYESVEDDIDSKNADIGPNKPINLLYGVGDINNTQSD
tara:strand:+ start:190 stop:540 length:351 start_codon:yes stop_codon:yes gene_type:complete